APEREVVEAPEREVVEAHPGLQLHPDYRIIASFTTGSGSYVRSLLADDRSVWIGTTEGIIQVESRSGEAVQIYTTQDGLLSPYIFTINKDRNGVYWFGTNNGGVSRFDGTSWKTFLPSDGLADFWVYGVDFADDGTTWIATWNGVSRFDGKGFKNYNTGDGLADRWVYALSIDSKGAIWFGTEGGVSRLETNGAWKTWVHRDGLGAPNRHRLSKSDNTGFGTLGGERKDDYKHSHNLSVLDPDGNETYNENYVFSMAIDRSDTKWFGTWGGGVSRFDGERWENFTTEDGLAGNIVYAVTVDPHDGAIWFGTNHGVSRFDGQNWISFTGNDGLANENVYAVAIDGDRRVWLGEKEGVDVLMARSSQAPRAPHR
ncbi:MAG: two-component regulator propeller domain-containing protein, partial [Nitrospiria bacterium]